MNSRISMALMITQSAIASLWVPYAAISMRYGEDRIRWVACLFLARLDVLDIQPQWLDVDWLVETYTKRQSFQAA
jgi:hypothetical protein